VQQPMLQSCLLGLCSNPYAQLTAVQRPMLQSHRCASHCATGPLCHRGCPWQGHPAVQVPGCFSLTIIYLRVASAQRTSRCGVWLVLKAMALQYHLHRQRGFSPHRVQAALAAPAPRRWRATWARPCYPAATLQLHTCPSLPCPCCHLASTAPCPDHRVLSLPLARRWRATRARRGRCWSSTAWRTIGMRRRPLCLSWRSRWSCKSTAAVATSGGH
jgi:hypothetical protein